VAGERIGRPERDPEARFVLVAIERDALGDRGREADPIALEVAVVHPDRIESLVARLAGPADDLLDIPARREAETDLAGKSTHGRSSLDGRTGAADRS